MLLVLADVLTFHAVTTIYGIVVAATQPGDLTHMIANASIAEMCSTSTDQIQSSYPYDGNITLDEKEGKDDLSKSHRGRRKQKNLKDALCQGDKFLANSTIRTREILKKCVERSEKDLARLFPDPVQYEEVRHQFIRYHRQARKYGMDGAKARILGIDVNDVTKEHRITPEERAERKMKEAQRYVVRRRLKGHPDDERMLARAKELGMDMNAPRRKRQPADFVKRFLDIYYPDMLPLHLMLIKDPELVIKKHPLGFSHPTKSRSKMELAPKDRHD